ncbi:MAG: funZ protein [Clostridia bacterium]|nr:funZ protein [Clostridia bacterium]
MLTTIDKLNLGFSDAQNYTQRANKKMLSEVFVKNSYLTKLLKPNVYYLVGEKGTGKTAYAAFLSNSEYESNKAFLKFISGTDYEKFYELKKRKQIDVSGYVDIWKTILLLLLAKSVTDNDKVVSIFNKNNLGELMLAIDEYYNRAFSPEIVNALKIVDKSEIAAKLVCKYAEMGGSTGNTVEFNEQRLQMNLFYICKKFSDCLGSLKLSKNLTLFVDGIDVRPGQIPYEEYLDCIKGLANACWSLNTELFANVRDSKGQFKVVLLLRPDIFNSLNLQNATNKLVDNAVYLDWRTTYTDYPTSNLYKMANKLLLHSQEEKEIPNIWEQYFDWKLKSSNPEIRENDTAFMEFLKISLSRPRDIQRVLSLVQEIMLERDLGESVKFDYSTYNSDRFQNMYSEYFLSSLKDQLSFYYSEEDYKHFKKFFDFFNDPQFTFEEYQTAYNKYVDYILENAKEIPKFVEDPKTFLQLLYDSNVITAIEENGRYFHFSYREKSPSNIAPEVPYDKGMEYRFHYGLYKKTKMGRYG